MIGKTISALLKADATLVALVGNDIYPYVMNPETDLPAVVYSIDEVEPSYAKNEWVVDDISFSVLSFAKDYSGLQDTADAVRDALELKQTGTGTQEIGRIYMTGQEEGYEGESDVFFCRQIFKLKVNVY